MWFPIYVLDDWTDWPIRFQGQYEEIPRLFLLEWKRESFYGNTSLYHKFNDQQIKNPIKFDQIC